MINQGPIDDEVAMDEVGEHMAAVALHIHDSFAARDKDANERTKNAIEAVAGDQEAWRLMGMVMSRPDNLRTPAHDMACKEMLRHFMGQPGHGEMWTKWMRKSESVQGDEVGGSSMASRKGESYAESDVESQVESDVESLRASPKPVQKSLKRKRQEPESESDESSAGSEKATKQPTHADGTTSSATNRSRRTTGQASYKEARMPTNKKAATATKLVTKPVKAARPLQTRASTEAQLVAKPARFRAARFDQMVPFGEALPQETLDNLARKCGEVAAATKPNDARARSEFTNYYQRLVIEDLFATGAKSMVDNLEAITDSEKLISDRSECEDLEKGVEQQIANLTWPEKLLKFVNLYLKQVKEQQFEQFQTFRSVWVSLEAYNAYLEVEEAYCAGDAAVVAWVGERPPGEKIKSSLRAALKGIGCNWTPAIVYNAKRLRRFLDICGGPAVLLVLRRGWLPNTSALQGLRLGCLDEIAVVMATEMAQMSRLVRVLDEHIWKPLVECQFMPRHPLDISLTRLCQDLKDAEFDRIAQEIENSHFPSSSQPARITAPEDSSDTKMSEAGDPQDWHDEAERYGALGDLGAEELAAGMATPMGQLSIEGQTAPVSPTLDEDDKSNGPNLTAEGALIFSEQERDREHRLGRSPSAVRLEDFDFFDRYPRKGDMRETDAEDNLEEGLPDVNDEIMDEE